MDIRIRLKNIPASDQQLLDDLLRVAAGRQVLTYAGYKANGSFSPETISRRFGTWQAALAKVGLKPHHQKGPSDEDLFADLLNVWERLGRQPSRNDMRRGVSKWSGSTFANHFRGWNDALQRFQKWVDGSEDIAISPASERKSAIKRTPRQPNLRLRFKVLLRDQFRCKCGSSPATDPSVVLHVDHVKPWVDGGETTLENLQTLCSNCNLGKSDG